MIVVLLLKSGTQVLFDVLLSRSTNQSYLLEKEERARSSGKCWFAHNSHEYS